MHAEISETSILFLVVGSLLLIGLATDYLGRVTALPRVTLLFIFGFLLGAGGFDVLPEVTDAWLPVIANMALLLVGFILGGRLTLDNLRENGLVAFIVSISVVVITMVFVCVGLMILGVPADLALLLAGIATATDPAATLDVIKESGSKGKFTDTLQNIVAMDDAWGLIIFSVLLAIVHQLNGSMETLTTLNHAAYELFGALALGAVLGFPMAWISGRIKPGEPTLIEALGMVLLCGGLALWLEVSYLLAAMSLGMVVTNFAKHHRRPFHEIEDIEWPFMILFFVLTGASLEIDMLSSVAVITLGYIAFRFIGRVVGSWPARFISTAEPGISRWMGMALLPQAGVAIGMALLVSSQLPEIADTIIPVVVIATVVFELVGPLFCRLSLKLAGESLNARNKHSPI